MIMNSATPTIITYGSQYGSAEHYAQKFAEYTGFPVWPYREVKSTEGYKRIIHFGALYAGDVLGLRQIVQQLPEDVLGRTRIFHLRGAIDYGKLNLKHRTMMALLYSKAKGLSEEKRNAETQAMIETYGKQVSFVDDTAVMGLANSICQK